jgi:hypothetical protein
MALLFDTKAAADATTTTITTAMGLGPGDGDVTLVWDVPRQDTNGKWVVSKPEDRFMAGVSGYTEGQPTWPADPGMA